MIINIVMKHKDRSKHFTAIWDRKLVLKHRKRHCIVQKKYGPLYQKLFHGLHNNRSGHGWNILYCICSILDRLGLYDLEFSVIVGTAWRIDRALSCDEHYFLLFVIKEIDTVIWWKINHGPVISLHKLY